MQIVFKHKYKKLYKYYKKILSDCNKVSFELLSNNMSYFINYLRFMRDYYILTLPIAEAKNNLNLGSLCYAINEYELYVSCISKYYILDNNILVIKDKNMSSANVQQLYQQEKAKHWDAFWQTVTGHMEDWFSEYADTL